LAEAQEHLYDQQVQPIEAQFQGMSANSELYLLDGPFDEPGARDWSSESITRTNSGISGEGQAGSFGAFAWSDKRDFTSASDVPSPQPGFAADNTSGIFTESSWYAYGVGGGHQL